MRSEKEKDLVDILEHADRVWNRSYGKDYELDRSTQTTRTLRNRMSVRCPKCHIPLTGSQIKKGFCRCGWSAKISQAKKIEILETEAILNDGEEVVLFNHGTNGLCVSQEDLDSGEITREQVYEQLARESYEG